MGEVPCFCDPTLNSVIDAQNKNSTIGPATEKIDALRQLIQKGSDVFRLNMSHATHGEIVARIRRLAHRCSAERNGYKSSLDRQLDIHRALFLAESATKFRKRNVLQLPDTLPSHAEFLAHFLKCLRLATIQPEALKNDLLFAVIQNVQQSADFVAEIFIAQ